MSHEDFELGTPVDHQELEAIAVALAHHDPPPVFFGAAVLPLYLDRAAVLSDPQRRPTEDVDVIVFAEPGPDQTQAVEADLQRAGWKFDMRTLRKSANRHAMMDGHGIPVDIVIADSPMEKPADLEAVDWPRFAASHAVSQELPSGRSIQIPTPAMFLACKVAASREPRRWRGEFDAHDVEDIATLLAGCSTLVASVRDAHAWTRAYLRRWLAEVSDGRTHYGSRTQALLEANWPRDVPEDLFACLAAFRSVV